MLRLWMVIDMADFSIPMFLKVSVDDEKINAIPEDIVLNNELFDLAITNLIKEELESYCTTTPNMVDLSIFIKDIPYEDYVYED
jgi:hypothetical protein